MDLRTVLRESSTRAFGVGHRRDKVGTRSVRRRGSRIEKPVYDGEDRLAQIWIRPQAQRLTVDMSAEQGLQALSLIF